MKVTVGQFFKPVSQVEIPSAADYEGIQPYIASARAFSRISYQSVYIVDYYRKGFLYVSDNPLFLCGHSPAVVLNLGYLFYLKNVPQEDLELLLEINEAGFLFYKDIPIADRLEYTISYDFNLIQPDKHLLLVNHQLSPLVLDKDGNIWLALCIVSTSSNTEPGNICIRKASSEKEFHYDRQQKKWQSQHAIKLSKTEREILLLSSQGLTMEDIAKKVFLSVHTIKFHRQSIFQKLQVKNISEAITFAANHRLL